MPSPGPVPGCRNDQSRLRKLPEGKQILLPQASAEGSDSMLTHPGVPSKL